MIKTQLNLKNSSKLYTHNIPENAKRVFKGILFDVYHWQQKMFDGSYETFEKVVRLPSSQIIAITPDKKIILLNEEQPFMKKFTGLVGGQIERNETPQENARKELLEELGMDTVKFKLWKIENFTGKVCWNTYYFIAKNCKKLQEPQLENGEKIKPFEVSFEKFLKEVQKEEFRNKNFANIIFKMIHTKGEIDKFKKTLFS